MACCPLVKNSTPTARLKKPDRGHGEGYDRFPMGNGQAPGIDTGRGASGADGSAAGWAAGARGAERSLGAAGFFLAAFFLADFLVGFFLAAFFTSALPADLRADFFAALRVSFFFLVPGLLAVFLRLAFLAMLISCFRLG